MTNSDTKKAFIYIIIGVILLGTGPMFVKYVHANGILVAFYRLFFASFMLSLMVLQHNLQHKKKEQTFSIGKTGIFWAVLGGVVFAINISLWCSALNYTTASAVTLLDNTAPVWVGLFSWIVLKEQKILALLAGIVHCDFRRSYDDWLGHTLQRVIADHRQSFRDCIWYIIRGLYLCHPTGTLAYVHIALFLDRVH